MQDWGCGCGETFELEAGQPFLSMRLCVCPAWARCKRGSSTRCPGRPVRIPEKKRNYYQRPTREGRPTRGRKAPGIDGMTISDFPAFWQKEWLRISRAIMEGNYRPAPVKRAWIPKPDGTALYGAVRRVVWDRGANHSPGPDSASLIFARAGTGAAQSSLVLCGNRRQLRPKPLWN